MSFQIQKLEVICNETFEFFLLQFLKRQFLIKLTYAINQFNLLHESVHQLKFVFARIVFAILGLFGCLVCLLFFFLQLVHLVFLVFNLLEILMDKLGLLKLNCLEALIDHEGLVLVDGVFGRWIVVLLLVQDVLDVLDEPDCLVVFALQVLSEKPLLDGLLVFKAVCAPSILYAHVDLVESSTFTMKVLKAVFF